MGDMIMKKAIILKVTGIILIVVSPVTICISKYFATHFPGNQYYLGNISWDAFVIPLFAIGILLFIDGLVRSSRS